MSAPFDSVRVATSPPFYVEAVSNDAQEEFVKIVSFSASHGHPEESAFPIIDDGVRAPAASNGRHPVECHPEASLSHVNDCHGSSAAACPEASLSPMKDVAACPASAAYHGCHPDAAAAYHGCPPSAAHPEASVNAYHGSAAYHGCHPEAAAIYHGCLPSAAHPEASVNAYHGCPASATHPEASLSPPLKGVYECFSIFGEEVRLPQGYFISNRTRKIVEVGSADHIPRDLVEALQKEHTQLLIELVDDILVFQAPSSNATDPLNVFEMQIRAYISRFKRRDLASKSSSALFHIPGQRRHACPDYSVHSLIGYDAALAAARAQNHTVPENVPVYLALEMQDLTQTEQEIRDICANTAQWLSMYRCISVALLVRTGMVEIYDHTGQRHAEYNPQFIDIGTFSPHLRGLRLYIQCLRDDLCWNYPNPHNHSVEGSVSCLMQALIADDFELGEEVVNHMFASSLADIHPLILIMEKAIQGVPGAFEFIRYLLANGAVVDGEDSDGISPYLVASASGNQQILALLPQHGAPIIFNTQMLSNAVDQKNVKLARLLIQAGCHPTADMLVKAIRMMDVELARLLILSGCNPNVPDGKGLLPLKEAIPDVVMISVLFESAKAKGFGLPKVHKRDVSGLSAWVFAKRCGQQEVLNYLEKYGR